MFKYTYFTKLKHLIFLNGRSTSLPAIKAPRAMSIVARGQDPLVGIDYVN
jgi:hypothetical protein